MQFWDRLSKGPVNLSSHSKQVFMSQSVDHENLNLLMADDDILLLDELKKAPEPTSVKPVGKRTKVAKSKNIAHRITRSMKRSIDSESEEVVGRNRARGNYPLGN